MVLSKLLYPNHISLKSANEWIAHGILYEALRLGFLIDCSLFCSSILKKISKLDFPFFSIFQKIF